MKLLVRSRPSDGATAVANALGIRKNRLPLNLERVRLSRRTPNIFLNWGVGSIRAAPPVRWINTPGSVTEGSNKFRSFQMWELAGVSIPEYTTRSTTAREWLGARGAIVLARSTVTGSGGEGITVVRHGEELPNALLYVKYVKKTHEYRVHVVNGNTIFVQQKRKRSGEEPTDGGLIRNHDRGWVFCENNVDPPSQATLDECVKAVRTLGLDFGAVDVIINRETGEPCVLEVNTAPGIESTRLLGAYKEAFQLHYGL